MKKLYSFCILLICFSITGNSVDAQTGVWSGVIKDAYRKAAYTMRVDPFGDILVAGVLEKTLDFDLGPGVHNLTGPANFIAKYDSAGNLLWVTDIGETSQTWSISFDLDAAGNIYLSGGNQLEILKISSSGVPLWSYIVACDSSSWLAGGALAYDASGYIEITGEYNNTQDFDAGPGVAAVSAAPGFTNMFLLKLDTLGQFVWVKSFDRGVYGSVTSDGLGNIYLAGSFRDTVDFDLGPNEHKIGSTWSADMFLMKMDAAGNFAWVRTGGAANCDDGASAVSMDNAGNITVLGNNAFMDTNIYLTTTDFLEQYDPAGNLAFRKNITLWSAKLRTGLMVQDQNNNFWLAGLMRDSADVTAGPGIHKLNCGDKISAFVMKLDAAANFVWAATTGGRDTTQCYPAGLAVDKTGGVYTTGGFSGNVDFDPGPGVDTATSLFFDSSNPFSPFDIYIQKWNDGTLDVKELQPAAGFNVFPNPVKNTLTIRSANEQIRSIILVDALGKELQRIDTDTKTLSVDVSNYSCGLYFLKINNSLGYKIMKN